MQCQGPYYNSCHKIYHIFILKIYHPIVHDENLECDKHSCDLSCTRFPWILQTKISKQKYAMGVLLQTFAIVVQLVYSNIQI